MRRILALGLIVSTVALIAVGVITLYDYNMTVGRMWQTPAIKPMRSPFRSWRPAVCPLPAGRHSIALRLQRRSRHLLRSREPAAIAAGKIAYQRYCYQCHGPNFDGYGTVGQSFAPPPGDLRTAKIQSMSPGLLFKEISYGIPDGRQPALATTMTLDERWHAIALVKSLGVRN